MRVQLSSPIRSVHGIMAIIFVLVSVAIIFAAFRYAAAAPGASLVGGSAMNVSTDTYVPVSGLQIDGDVIGTVPVNVKVDQGTLRLGVTTGLTLNGSSTGKSISFSASKADANAALASLEYRSNSPRVAQFTATIGSEDMVYYPGNGHVYEVITVDEGVNWFEADTLAQARTFNGAPGYLATITSQAENDYITGRLSGDGWFGASDDAAEGDWRWVSGPESGDQFWSGLSASNGGQSVDGAFSNWAPSEPNDSGSEDCAQFYGSGTGWNDLNCTSNALGSYVVEYGTDELQPTAPSSREFTITSTTPTPQVVVVNDCQDFFDSFVGDNQHRYDIINITQDLDCTGYTLPSLFAEYDDEESVPIGFQGVFNGNNHAINNLTIEPVYDEEGEFYSVTGLFGYLTGGTVKDLNLQNVTVSGHQCIGSLVGVMNSGVIENVTVSGVVESAPDVWTDAVGGLVGCIESSNTDESEITDSTFAGTVNGKTTGSTGGIIGEADVETGSSLTIDTISSTATVIADEGSVGGIIGDLDVEGTDSVAVLNNTSSMGLINETRSRVGGIIGYVQAEDGGHIIIDDANVEGDVIGAYNVGGLVGYAEAYDDDTLLEIRNSTIAYDVKGFNDNVGGIIGIIDADVYEGTAVYIHNNTVTGSISGNVIVGGVAGYVVADTEDDSTKAVELSRNSVDASVSGVEEGSQSSIGGIIGSAQGVLINQSYVVGTVQGVSSIGGIAGSLDRSTIKDSYSRVTVTAETVAGGIVAELYDGSEIINSYATGVVVGDASTGGIVGQNNSFVTELENSYWDVQSTGQPTSALGEGKTTAAMKQMATFVDWDFTTIWGLSPTINNGYPCLQWVANGCDTDVDTDGIGDGIEAAAPNGGDANNDGIQDAVQSHVSSLVNPISGDYVTLVVDNTCSLSDVYVEAAEDIAVSDEEYLYQTGLLNFSADCGTPGITITVTQYYYGVDSLDGLTVRKFNPTTGEYQTVTGHNLSLTLETIGGASAAKLAYTVTDGDELDTDGVINGTIIDPIGLASTNPSAPNTGFANQGIVGLFIAVASGIMAVILTGFGSYRFVKRSS